MRWLRALASVVAGLVAAACTSFAGPPAAAKGGGPRASASASASASAWMTSAHPLPLHWMLSGPLNISDPVQTGQRDAAGHALPRPAVLDIDGEVNTAATVAALHARGQHVICYVDAGVFEDYRSDAARFPASVIGAKDQGWAGSRWLDIRQRSTLLPIMRDRIQHWCADKGFDAVEPDEIDGYENSSGFPLTYADQVAYNRAVADLAHSILRPDGTPMAIIQKGDIIQTRDLVGWFDGTLNEECYRYGECVNPYNPGTGQEQVGLQAYTRAGKPVWVAEYTATAAARMCSGGKGQPAAVAAHWNGARYKLGLPANGGRRPCPGTW